MARKRKKRAKSPILKYRRLPIAELVQDIEYARDRGNIRAAIDMAKECCRREAGSAHTERLIDLYYRRARQLMEKNLCTEALVVAVQALSLGPGSAELLRIAFDCGLRSGDYATALRVLVRLRDGAEQATARIRLADEAVAHGDRVGGLCDPIIRDDAARIRRAFAAYEQADDRAAGVELKPIGLKSPCAGWKWLLRGLMARARDDSDAARAYWGRTGDNGRAAQLARVLLSVLPVELGSREANADGADSVRVGVHKALGHPQLDLLEQVKVALDCDDPRETLARCRELIATVSADDREAYARRLGRVVCASIDMRKQSPVELRRVFGTLPEDPHLFRMLALSVEANDADGAIYEWKFYLHRLERVEAVPPHLRKRVRALVWRHMGEVADNESASDSPSHFHDDPFGLDAPIDLDAAEFYRESIKLCPDDCRTHERLLATLQGGTDMKAAERQADAILQRWPNHIDSLLFLGTHCFERNAFRKALKYFDRAREAEPFNARPRRAMQDCLLRSARRRLDNGNVDLARQDYRQAETLSEADESLVSLYCKWAALEWRAERPDEAGSLFARAVDSGDGSLPVYYQMAIELSRAKAPPDVQARFEVRLSRKWGEPSTGATAAAVAELMLAHQTSSVRYTGRDAHRKAAMRFFAAARKGTTFNEDQLLVICRCLLDAEEKKLAEGYAKKACRQFPDNYYFPLYLGRAQKRGRYGQPSARTRRLLYQAQKQARTKGDFKAAAEIAWFAMSGLATSMPDNFESFQRLVSDLDSDVANPFDDLDDDADDERPPEPRPRPRRRPESNQPVLFDDLYETQEPAD